jgi:hypothetical protein
MNRDPLWTWLIVGKEGQGMRSWKCTSNSNVLVCVTWCQEWSFSHFSISEYPISFMRKSSKVNMSWSKIQFLPQHSQDQSGYYSILMVYQNDFKYKAWPRFLQRIQCIHTSTSEQRNFFFCFLAFWDAVHARWQPEATEWADASR